MSRDALKRRFSETTFATVLKLGLRPFDGPIAPWLVGFSERFWRPNSAPTASNPKAKAHPPGSFLTIQALRAVAALLVVLLHAFETWGQRVDPAAPGVTWGNGAAGVDIFFVISGFVMVVASRRLVGRAGGWLTFLQHRIVRIVPLYWLITTAKIAAVLLLPMLVMRTSLDLGFVVRSFLFLPVVDSAGHFRPVVSVGWTLTYEFLFYLFFAAALAMRIDVLRVVIPASA